MTSHDDQSNNPEEKDLPQPASQSNPFRWYVLRVATGYEQRVSGLISDLIVRERLEGCIGEILVPIEQVVEVKAGQKRKSQRKFFPGYILIQINLTDDIVLKLRHLNHVLGFVGGTKGRPAPVSQKEVDRIVSRVEDGVDQVRPKVVFEPGESVQVIDGPFADFQGVVEDINYEKSRLRVSVLIFGRATPVELEFSQVEKSV